MRLYPPAWGLGRRRTRGDQVGGHAIPAGRTCSSPPWVIHRHPGFWPDPERFDSRPLPPEAEAARHRHAYFPFGGGPRACIGQCFSMLEAIITLVVLMRDFDVASDAARVPLAPRSRCIPRRPCPCVRARVARPLPV